MQDKILYEFVNGPNCFCITQDEDRRDGETPCIRLHEKGKDSLGNVSWRQVLCTHLRARGDAYDLNHLILHELLLLNTKVENAKNND